MEIYIILSLAFLAAWAVYSRRWPRGNEFPPGPPPLPIFGNIFQIGLNPHKSLTHLAKTYGPLMSLKLGTQFAVVVSSPEMAKEILLKHGSAFSNRSAPAAFCAQGHDRISMGLVPGGSDRFKKLRRLSRETLFSNQALQASQHVRQERLRKLADHVSKCSCEGRAMSVGEATFTTMSNLMFATLFSTELMEYGAVFGSVRHKELKEHMNGIISVLGSPNISDFFPVFAPLDPQRLERRMSRHVGALLEMIGRLIEQRLQERDTPSTYQKKNDFLETLLDLMEGNEYDLSFEEIQHLCMDLLVTGSDVSAATTEWAMVELLLHPDKLAKLKVELKSVVGDKRIIEESDISKLPYLQAIIKETMRYHPIGPLLKPREAAEEKQIMGYRIPKNAKIIVNFWAITRNPSIWKDPESFEPERFLDNNIDFRGQHFELIPFGSGRRICPGISLASCMMHCMVGTLCHNFDWKFEEGAGSKSVEREDIMGLALQKKSPRLFLLRFDVFHRDTYKVSINLSKQHM